jgi:uncharacterized protein YbjT (DUF2867 family)
MGKTALLVGATGLVGRQVLELLLQSNRYELVRVVSRQPLSVTHPKIQSAVTSFDRLQELADLFQVDDIYCCLGTTIRKVKTQEAFRQIDFHYPLQVAQLGKEQGAKQYLLVSALGANAKSSIFYNRVKGDVEEAVSKLGYRSLHIFRPSLLLGPREESRSGEDAAKIFYRIFGFLIPAKYKGIEARKVAAAMLECAAREEPGIYLHESAAMQGY